MLYERIIGQGTLNEPTGKPNPQFALPSTAYWMKSLRIILENHGLNFASASDFYISEGRRNMDELVENTIFEQLLLSLHHLSALGKMSQAKDADYARIGILSWYYGIYNAASAMIAARNGSLQEDHSNTAKQWDQQIAVPGLAMEPFSWRISSLIKRTYLPEIERYRQGSSHKLFQEPLSLNDAYGAAASYLSGSADWYVWKETEHIKSKDKQFRELGVSDFKTKKAREIRDSKLSQKSIGFMHQAIRYRGKANYREALFLAYGKKNDTLLSSFVEDQYVVLKAYLQMAGGYVSRKLGQSLWRDFTKDVEDNRSFELSPTTIWDRKT